jgi:hypothetical protein
MAKVPVEEEQLDISALVDRPEHLEAIGLLTVEITHMERAVSELFASIMGIHFFLAEAIYFTVNSGIARMDIVRNAAHIVLSALPQDLKRTLKFLDRAKTAMGKRHAIIHSFWMLNPDNNDIRREKLGEFRNKRVAVVTLTELRQQIRDVQKITNETYNYCYEFQAAHPGKVGALRDYWAPKERS